MQKTNKKMGSETRCPAFIDPTKIPLHGEACTDHAPCTCACFPLLKTSADVDREHPISAINGIVLGGTPVSWGVYDNQKVMSVRTIAIPVHSADEPRYRKT